MFHVHPRQSDLAETAASETADQARDAIVALLRSSHALVVVGSACGRRNSGGCGRDEDSFHTIRRVDFGGQRCALCFRGMACASCLTGDARIAVSTAVLVKARRGRL